MKLIARCILGLVLLGLLTMLGFGLAEVAAEHGIGTALAVFPGIPIFSLALLVVIYTAFPG